MDNGPGSATVIASLALLGLHMSVDRIGDGRIGAACFVLVDDRGALAVVAHPRHQVFEPHTAPGARRAALKRARRRNIAGKAAQIQAALRAEQLGQPPAVTAAYAASVRALAAVLVTLNEQVKAMQGQVETHFGQHPAAEIITSQPGLGPVLGARVLAEFGDDPVRYASAKARKNYAATSPITRASGKKKTALARFVHNGRLIDALMAQAFTALNTSPGARAYYQRQRARGAGHNPALRQLANRLVGILHGCLKTGTPYDETTAWSHHAKDLAD